LLAYLTTDLVGKRGKGKLRKTQPPKLGFGGPWRPKFWEVNNAPKKELGTWEPPTEGKDKALRVKKNAFNSR